MIKSKFKIISRLLVLVLIVLMIPVGITWAKYSLSLEAGEIEFSIQPDPSVSTYADESTVKDVEENSKDTANGGAEAQEVTSEQEDDTAEDAEPETTGEEPEKAEN